MMKLVSPRLCHSVSAALVYRNQSGVLRPDPGPDQHRL
jgi:hypothetical protein